jgi:putative transposase
MQKSKSPYYGFDRQLRSDPATNVELPWLANVKHVFVRASPRANNRAENSHQPTRRLERRM